MPHKQQPFWEKKQQSYANVETGAMIVCSSCEVSRFKSRFSNNQIRKYQEAIVYGRRNGQPVPLPRCIDCTAGNVVELTCQGCQIIKGANFFSKVQRKAPDIAKCRNCVQDTDDLPPYLKDALEEERLREEQSRGAGPTGSVLPSVNGSTADSGLFSQTQSISGDGVYIVEDRESVWGGPQGSVPSSSLDNSMASTLRTKSVHSQATGNSGFHKQAAYRPPVQARVANRLQREEIQRQEAQLGSRQDDSDDDEEFEL